MIKKDKYSLIDFRLKDIPTPEDMYVEFRQKAIEEYKKLRQQIDKYDSELFKNEILIGSLLSYNIQCWKAVVEWIGEFFNITQDDLK